MQSQCPSPQVLSSSSPGVWVTRALSGAPNPAFALLTAPKPSSFSPTNPFGQSGNGA